MIYNIFSNLTQVWDVFLMDPDPDFSGSDHDFWPIRIRTQKKNSDPDTEKTGSEKLKFLKDFNSLSKLNRRRVVFPLSLFVMSYFSDPGSFLNNPAMMNMASSMLQDPNMQNM